MKVLLLIIAWCVLLALSWPMALVALIAAPVVWLFSLPLRLIGVCVESIIAHEDLPEPATRANGDRLNWSEDFHGCISGSIASPWLSSSFATRSCAAR